MTDRQLLEENAARAAADRCRKCNGEMRLGTYLAQSLIGVPDFPNDRHAVTVSPGGPGRLEPCLKCSKCGWSVTTADELRAL